MYIRLSTSPRMKDRWHFFLMDSILCIYKQGNQQVQSQNIMQLPQTSEHTAQRENLIPRRCHLLYKCLEHKHNKVEFTCFHKSKIFLFNCLWFPQDSGYWPCMILRSMGVDQYCSENSYVASLPLCLLLPLPPPSCFRTLFFWLLLVLHGSVFTQAVSFALIGLAIALSEIIPRCPQTGEGSRSQTPVDSPCSTHPSWSFPVTCVTVRPMLEGSTTERPEPRAVPATDKHVLNKWTKTWIREGKQVWRDDRKSSCGGRKVTVYFPCSKTDGRKANEAVKWEEKKKAGEVVGKVGRKAEGRQSLGERREGRGGSRVCSAWRVSRRRRSRVEVSMSWEGQAEQAFGSFQISSQYVRLFPSPSRIRVPVRDSVFHPVSSITLNPTLCSLGENCRWKSGLQWQEAGLLASPPQHGIWVRNAVIPQDQRRVSMPQGPGVTQWGDWRATVHGVTGVGQGWATNTLLLHFTSTEQAQELPEEQSLSPPIGFPTMTSTQPMTQQKSNPPMSPRDLIITISTAQTSVTARSGNAAILSPVVKQTALCWVSTVMPPNRLLLKSLMMAVFSLKIHSLSP